MQNSIAKSRNSLIRVRDFVKEAATFELNAIFYLLGIITIVSNLLLVINNIYFGYSGTNYIASDLWKFLPGLFLLYIVGLYIEEDAPRLSLFFRTFWLLNIIIIVLLLAETAFQYTPFHSYDGLMIKIDHFFGYHVLSVMNWGYAHPHLQQLLFFAYRLLPYALLATPLILAILLEKRQIEIYFVACLFSALIGFSIYYLMPTTDPAYVLQSPHFTAIQHAVVTKFNALHHHQPITSAQGGLISFPSFHVLWAIMIAYAFRFRKYLFPIAVVFSTLVIISTLTLGWHYLIDVIGGAALAIASIYVAERFLVKTPRCSLSG